MPDDRCECCDLPAYSCGKAIEKRELKEAKDNNANALQEAIRKWVDSP